MLNIELPATGRTVWTSTWPTREGVYWFYGFPWGKSKVEAFKGDKPDLLCVRVLPISNGFIYVAEGYTIADTGREAAVGFWAPVVLPDAPTSANVTDDGKHFRS